MNQSTYRINGITVYLKTLPSSDIAIRFPYDDDVNKVIRNICKNRGYWHSEHNNWIVYKQYKTAVCKALTNISA